MCSTLLDSDAILSENEHWSRLDQEWGTPIDLDMEELPEPTHQSFFSTFSQLPTLDSEAVMQQIRQQMCDSLSNHSESINYKDFLEDLDQDNVSFVQEGKKQFYFIGGQIISAASVDEICKNIDKAFKSVSKLSGSTSTIRKVPHISEVVECSISSGDLSFDDTNNLNIECDDNVDRIIDDLFEELDNTMASLQQTRDPSASVLEASTAYVLDQTRSVETVTMLVKKFSCMLESPAVKCSPRRRRECCTRFRDLAEFWRARAMNLD